ncbi:unnamed protein product [Phytophthora lilii]|uniref:Unnamed protein product n=1 Tax=Phytophthora lilii TaxID=2077276 RepID=A0A9W6TT73_9STRA|nr:unnamed protein product [Phytophthora lilii]
MSGFFSDNQTKQKAYDRYYNTMAKSDFVQGKKLKALIQRESLDDASTDSLANLFQQVMGKSRRSDDEETKEEIKEEKILRGLNAGIKKVYTDDINSYKSQFAANLYESIRHRFGDAVEQRKGKDYFEDNAPKPPKKHKMKRDAMNQYKAELKGWLDGIFI